MHQGKNYQDLSKWAGYVQAIILFLGHSLNIK